MPAGQEVGAKLNLQMRPRCVGIGVVDQFGDGSELKGGSDLQGSSSAQTVINCNTSRGFVIHSCAMRYRSPYIRTG